MIAAGAYPVFDPGGLKKQKQVNSVKVMMTEGMHDTAVITLRSEALDVPELQPGTPVKMQYGWLGADLDWFYGYIDHVDNHYDYAIPDGSTYEDVVCLGASYSLKDPYVGAWAHAQASTLVKMVANKYFLSTVVEDDDTIWPNLTWPGDSAWCFLIDLANRTGYSLACNQTTVRFNSVDLGLRRYGPTMPIFRSRRVAPNFLDQSITRFQTLQGESLPISGGTKALRQINGVDMRTGTIVGAINDGQKLPSQLGTNVVYPFFGQQVSDRVAVSQGHANDILNGMAQHNRFNYTASATLSGLTSVKQGTPIVIKGIDSNQDGVWWVQEVTHKIVSQGYSMDVMLGSDSLGDSGMRPVQKTKVAYTPTNPFSYSITNVPETKLINNRWRAAYQFNVDIC
jgi:phage protein D